MNKIITASGNKVEPYWPGLFSKALKGQDIGALLANVGSAAPAGGAVGGGAAAGGDAPAEAKKEGKKPFFVYHSVSDQSSRNSNFDASFSYL